MSTISSARVNSDSDQLVLKVFDTRNCRRAALPGPILLVARNQVLLHVRGHVQPKGEGEVSVDLLLEHGQHVEGVAHRVEGDDAGQALEAGAFFCANFFLAL